MLYQLTSTNIIQSSSNLVYMYRLLPFNVTCKHSLLLLSSLNILLILFELTHLFIYFSSSFALFFCDSTTVFSLLKTSLEKSIPQSLKHSSDFFMTVVLTLRKHNVLLSCTPRPQVNQLLQSLLSFPFTPIDRHYCLMPQTPLHH